MRIFDLIRRFFTPPQHEAPAAPMAERHGARLCIDCVWALPDKDLGLRWPKCTNPSAGVKEKGGTNPVTGDKREPEFWWCATQRELSGWAFGTCGPGGRWFDPRAKAKGEHASVAVAEAKP